MTNFFDDQLPLQDERTKTAKIGTRALEKLLSSAHMPNFEVPQSEDKGIDILANVVISVNELPDKLKRESAWVREWASDIDLGPSNQETKRKVIGQFVAFQVKASNKHLENAGSWSASINISTLNFWRTSNIPVIIIVSNSDGQLKFLEASAIELPRKKGQDSVTIRAEKDFTAGELNLLQQKVRTAVAIDSAFENLPGVFSPDTRRQREGITAAWALIAAPDTCRIVLSALPVLHPEQLAEGMLLVAEWTRYLEGKEKDVSSVKKRRIYEAKPDLPAYSDDTWIKILNSWSEVELLEVKDSWHKHRDGFVKAPNDPWPSLNDEVDLLAKRVHSVLPSVSLNEAVIVILSLADDYEDLVIRLGCLDRNTTSPRHTISWWATFFLEVERLAGLQWRENEHSPLLQRFANGLTKDDREELVEWQDMNPIS